MDGEAFTGIAILVGIVVVVGVIAFFIIRAERKLQAALQELAESRGWRYETFRDSGFGRRRARKRFTMTPTDSSEGWTLEVTRRSSSNSGGRSRGKRGSRNTTTTDPGRAEFRAPAPAFQGGLAVFSTGMTAKAMGLGGGGTADSLMGMFDNKVGKAVMGHFLGADVGEHMGQLKSFPAPAGSKMTVMATADPSMFFDLAAIDEALASWKPAKGLFKASPMMIVSESGVRLMVGQQITDPESVAGLIDLGLSLRERATRGG